MSKKHSCLLSLVATLFFLASSAAQAQLAEVVADIFLSSEDVENRGSAAGGFVRMGNASLFFADHTSTGRELWRTDGTAAGTFALADACVGSCGSGFLAVLGSRAVWVAFDRDVNGETAPILWSTDGTASGSEPLLRLDRYVSERPFESAVVGGKMLFRTWAPLSGQELWQTDGTREGTQLLADIVPGQSSGFPQQFLVENDVAYFFAGRAVWRSDGTSEGTREIGRYEGSEDPEGPVVTEGKVYFTRLSEDFDGTDLYVADAARGAVELVFSFPHQGSFGFLAGVGGKVFLAREGEDDLEQLWVSDGTTEGTHPATDFIGGRPFGSWGPSQIAAAGGQFLFLTRETSGSELWSTRGTVASTQRLLPVCRDQGPCLTVDSREGLKTIGDRVVFSGADESRIRAAWSSDGTAGGTAPLGGAESQDWARDAKGFANLDDDRVIFTGRVSNRFGDQLWTTDGTPDSLQPLTRYPEGQIEVSTGRWFGELPRGLVVSLDTQRSGAEPWVSRGLVRVPEQLADINREEPASDPRQILSAGESLLFLADRRAASSGSQAKVWRTAGNPGEVELIPVDPSLDSSFEIEGAGDLGLVVTRDRHLWAVGDTGAPVDILDLAATPAGNNALIWTAETFGGSTYFVLEDFINPNLWRTDGTVGGTEEVLEEAAGAGAILVDVKSDGQRLLLVTEKDRGDGACELWAFRGEAGRVRFLAQLADSGCAQEQGIEGIVNVAGVTYFFFRGDFGRLTMWATDGTTGGTFSPFGGITEAEGAGNAKLVHLGDSLYFVAERTFRDVGHLTLWRYRLDRQEPQPVLPLPFSSRLQDRCIQLESLGDKLFFVVDDGDRGCELWESDGTEEGTRMVRDIAPGRQSSEPRDLLVVGDQLYFVARDFLHGAEVWTYDAARGARLAHDLFPGPQSSFPSELTLVGDRLVFAADDGLRGRELWSLPLDGGPACRASETALCLQEGRFRVEARWRNFSEVTGDGTAVTLTRDTGYFWFFNPDNVEVALKVLNGIPQNDHYWTFFGALSNVEYALTVADSQTGVTRRYNNPSRNFASVGDTQSFGPLGASLESFTEPVHLTAAAQPQVTHSVAAGGQGEPCLESPTRLCLNEGRFAVEVTWETPSGNTGVGTAVPLTEDTGYMWFFQETNVELLVKLLDGRELNGHHWVFYGSLSNIDFDVMVTDTQTGTIRTYQNRNRRFASVGDTEAFSQTP